MPLNAISKGTMIGGIEPIQPPVSSPDPAQDQTADPPSAAKPIVTGTPNPLSPTMLAALVAEQIQLYGSYSA
jgi:hypothetical protein